MREDAGAEPDAGAGPPPEPSGAPADVVVVANRGPLSFALDERGELQVRRGAGGLVVTLGPGAAAAGAVWVGTASSEADRKAAAGGEVDGAGFRTHALVVDDADYRAYYDVVANGTLWYVLHGLWDAPRRPRFDRRWHDAWDRYRAVNERYAAAVAELAAPGATVLVQDYHLALVPAALAEARPDLRLASFIHTPWCSPAEWSMLPDRAARAVLGGLTGADAGRPLPVGFHSARWARAFAACCEELLGQPARTFVAPAAPDAADTAAAAVSSAGTAAAGELSRRVGDRFLIVRVDRMELSKNVLRGFHAFDELLETRADLRGRVVFGAFVYPSRTGLADYLAYGQEVRTLAARINDTWGDGDWTPILLDPTDDYPRSVAALARADALLVNPVRDGLNLVAKELAVVNEHDGVLVLSDRAGVYDELGPYALAVNPFDVSATAAALGAAVDMSRSERAERADGLRKVVADRSPLDWFNELVTAAR